MTTPVTLACWKTHECVGCGARFRYRMERTRNGIAPRPEAERERAVQLASQALRTEVDSWPCPVCGILQPVMLRAALNSRYLGLVLLTGGFALASVCLWTLDMVYRPAHAIAAGVAALAFSIAIAAVGWLHPNADLAANRRRAAAGIQKKALVLLAEGASQVPQVIPGRWNRATLALGLALGAAAILGPVSEIVRGSVGWPANPEAWPPVAGPGDTVRIYFPRARSVKGYWCGDEAVAMPINPRDLQLGSRTFTARTREDSWGSTISVKDAESNSSFQPWVEVTVPPLDHLEGRAVKLRVRLALTYPVASGRSFFNQNDTMQRDVDLALASRGAGARYNMLWILGVAAAGVIPMAGAFYLLLRVEVRETIEIEPIASVAGP